MEKKILLVTFSDNADHQDVTFGIYEQLVKTEDVYLLCIKKPRVPLERSERTWLVDCPERPGVTKKTFNIVLLMSLIYRIHKEKFDVIYFESLHTWNLPIMLLAGTHTHTYQVIHEVIPHEGDAQEKMVDVMNKTVIKLADNIVLRNKIYIPALIERYNIAPGRVKYLELWRRYPDFTEPVHSGRVLFFGRINPYKGTDNLLEIVRLCPEINFEVVGRVDPQMQGVVDELKKESNVRLNNDYVSDEEMRKSFVDADWVVLPYNSASQSGIIIDAYKYSRPVIAFNVGAIVEQIEDGKSGYLVDSGNNVQFAKALKSAVHLNTINYDEMCKYAFEYGCKKYAATGAVTRFKELICERESNNVKYMVTE